MRTEGLFWAVGQSTVVSQKYGKAKLHLGLGVQQLLGCCLLLNCATGSNDKQQNVHKLGPVMVFHKS